MRVHIVDPAAYTPPYDHSLASALARAGIEVELITSRFPHGSVPPGNGYEVRRSFYPGASGIESPAFRRMMRAIEHGPGMLGYGRYARNADVVHYQWLPLPRLDRRLLAPVHPRVFTMHWRLPERGSGVARKLARLLERMDSVIAHTHHGSARLSEDFGVPPERIEVIPNGAFDYLTRLPDEQPLPMELRGASDPVILAFGLIRPYKGTEVLLEAFGRLSGAELWVVGRPMQPTSELHRLAERAPGRVRFLERFIDDAEIPAIMRRADVVALPYLNIEQSGVLHTALAFGRPLVLSDVGGFPEVAELGAARLTPAGDADALAGTLSELLADPAERERLATGAAAAAAGPYSWDAIARSTLS